MDCFKHISALVLAVLSGCGQEAMEHKSVLVGGHAIRVEIALSSLQKYQGLQGRNALEVDSGMLFVLSGPEKVCLWMHRTPMDLDAAFISPDHRITSIVSMQANTKTEHCAPEPSSFVLEMERGWFESRELGVGARLDLSKVL